MNKYCMIYKLKQDRIEDYIKCHESMGEEQVNALKDAGARDLEIYLWKQYCIIAYECSDFEAFLEVLSKSEVNEKWQKIVGPMFADEQHLSGENKIEPLKKIFSLKEIDKRKGGKNE